MIDNTIPGPAGIDSPIVQMSIFPQEIGFLSLVQKDIEETCLFSRANIHRHSTVFGRQRARPTESEPAVHWKVRIEVMKSMILSMS